MAETTTKTQAMSVNSLEEDTLSNKYLIFYLDNQQYAIAIQYVIDIINVQPVTRVPSCPEFVRGITNLRGKVIPIIDVRLRFANRLIGVVIDRFGRDIIIHRQGEEHFTLTVRIVVSPQFLAWLYGFGGEVQVLAPPAVVRQVQDGIRALAGVYAE